MIWPGWLGPLALVSAAAANSDTRRAAVCNLDRVREVNNPTSASIELQVVSVEAPLPCEVPAPEPQSQYQVLSSGEVLFQMGLRAGESRAVSLRAIVSNAFPVHGAVQIKETPDQITVANDRLEVVLRKSMDLSHPLPPVRSISPRSGSVVLNGTIGAGEFDRHFDPTGNSRPKLTAYSLTVLEKGPLLTRLRATFSFSHPAMRYGEDQIVFPPDENGFASQIIELRAGVNAVFFEEESNYNWVNGYEVVGLDMNQLRYRGHHADDVAAGYTIQNGEKIVYESCCGDTEEHVDATRDLTEPLAADDYNRNPFVQIWNPWSVNGGRFVIARDGSGHSTNWVAAIGGAAGRVSGAGFSGVKFVGLGRHAQLLYLANGRGPDASIYRHIRYPWALSIGAEPITPANVTPEAGLIQNQQINFPLTKLLQWLPESDTEMFSSSGMYLQPAQQDRLSNRLRNDALFARRMGDREPASRNLLQLIAGDGTEQAQKVYSDVTTTHRDMLDAFWQRNGVYENKYMYWMGALAIRGLTPGATIAVKSLGLSAEKKRRIYQAMVFFGYLMLDNDFVPLHDGADVGMGTANMPLQYISQRDGLLLTLLGNRGIRNRFNPETLTSRLRERLAAYVSDTGASRGSPHYTSAGVVPTLNLCQQARVANLGDCARSDPRVPPLGRFMLDLVTPPEVRFGGKRKLVTFGDGPTEASEILGQLATMLAEAQPDLSRQLMAAWTSIGEPFSDFYQSSILKIDQSLPRLGPKLHDATYPDYLSVMRSGFGTEAETALWFLHGDFFHDHRSADQGAPIMYLMGVPASVSWGSMYSPRVSSSLLANTITMAADAKWDGSSGLLPALADVGYAYPTHDVTGVTGDERARATATFQITDTTTWSRTVELDRAVADRPIVVIRDTFNGPDAAAEKILNLNLMARGGVATPSGVKTPPDGGKAASSTDFFPLPAGWNRFEFKGQWGVDYVLLVESEANARFQLGSFKHSWAPGREWDEFKEATGRDFEEAQYQFRIWSKSSSRLVLVPYRSAGVKPVVEIEGRRLTVDSRSIDP